MLMQTPSTGDSSCQALYGPGTIAAALDIDNFDAVVFLIQFNQGYPMTIPDMAKAFTMLDKVPATTPDTQPIAVSSGGGGHSGLDRRATAPATIACNNGAYHNTKDGMEGDDPTLCNHPTFTINLPLITLPNIDQTADQVLKRIIPAPNGDCKIVVYPEQQSFPDYGMTILGSASAIACGLNAGSTLVGDTIPVGSVTTLAPSSATTGAVPVSDGSQSTNGENGAFVAAPPEAPFAPINSTQAVCIGFSNTANDLCLPAGTYGNQDGGLGFTLSDAISLTVPSGTGYSLTAKYTPAKNPNSDSSSDGGGASSHVSKRDVSNVYSVDTQSSIQLKNDFTQISNPGSGGTFVIASPSDPPAVCLFT